MPIKENSADKLQREKLEREREISTKSRICDILTTVLFCLFIGGFALLHVLTPDREYSEKENRYLEEFPEFSSDALFSGDFTSDVTKYLSDQFPMRDLFVNIKATSERLTLRSENGGIMFSDDSLTARNDHPNMENLSVNMSASSKLSAALENKGIPTIFAAAGRRVDVCTDDLPMFYGDESQNELWNDIDTAGKEFPGSYVNLRDPLKNPDSLGDEVYFRTDHHWNTLGAYTAYTKIWEYLPKSLTDGKEVRKTDFFTRETVSEDFLGTSFSSSGASWITPDKIELFRFDGDDTIPVKNHSTGEIHEGLYFREFLDVRDKYSVFLGENIGRLDIGTGDRKTIVMIKDSFAQSVAPFLAVDFDVVMIDPRYYRESIYDTILEISPEAVIILLNADSLTSTPVLRPLMRGVE